MSGFQSTAFQDNAFQIESGGLTGTIPPGAVAALVVPAMPGASLAIPARPSAGLSVPARPTATLEVP